MQENRAERQYEMFLFERKAICPECHGMMAKFGKGLRYQCIDCKSFFSVTDMGNSEEYMLGKKVCHDFVKNMKDSII